MRGNAGEASSDDDESKDRVIERAIAVIDIVGSTEICRAVGDQRFAEVLRGFCAAVRASATEHGASELDTRGDGFIHLYPSVAAAIAGTRSLLASVDRASLAGPRPIVLRGSVHYGRVACCGSTMTGLALHYACELGDLAPANHIWVSAAANQQETQIGVEGDLVCLPKSGWSEVFTIPGRTMTKPRSTRPVAAAAMTVLAP